MTLGEKIKKLRKQRKMTLKQLGEVLGFASNTLCMYENNTRTPSYETLKKIADHFSVPFTWFFCEYNENKEVNEIARQLRCSQRHIRELLATAQAELERIDRLLEAYERE